METKETLEGQHELFEGQDSHEEGYDDENGPASGVEIDEMSVDEEAEDNDDHASTESESDSNSEPEENQEELFAFESKLAAALGTHRGDQDINASEDDKSSDEDMDDEQMEELDEKLVEIFKARQAPVSKKKEQKDAKQMVVQFKGRVLGLLEVYIKNQSTNELVLNLIIPLLQLIRTTRAKHLADKSFHLIRELGKQGKNKGLIQLHDLDHAWRTLDQVHKEACTGGSNAFATACSQSSILVVKALVGHSRDAVSRVVDVYGETRKHQLQDKNCHVHPSFFTEWSNWCVSASQRLRKQYDGDY